MARTKEFRTKEELLRSAGYLFTKNGFSATSVSAIVKQAGFAQGTFYLYFKSKDDCLNAYGELLADEICQKVIKISNQEKMNGYEKLAAIHQTVFQGDFGHAEYIKHYHRPENIQIHNTLTKSVNNKLLPVFTEIIRQGIKERIFDVSQPEESAAIIISMADTLNHEAYLTNKENRRKMANTIFDFTLKGLGYRKRTN